MENPQQPATPSKASNNNNNNKPLVATRELGFYCFDVVISSLETTHCAPPNFPDGKCPVCISWARSRKEPASGPGTHAQKKPSATPARQFEARGSLVTPPLRLHSEDLVRSIRDSAFGDPRQPSIKADDVQHLRVSVSLILEDSYKVLTDPDDWEIGKHGIRVEFEHQGEQCSKVYPPEPILARGWSKPETIQEAIKKAGYPRELTPEFMATVKITRLETSTCIVSFQDYLKHAAEQDKRARDGQIQYESPADEERCKTTRRRRRRYIKSWSQGVTVEKVRPPQPAQPKRGGFGKWVFILAVVLMILGIFLLRFLEATYDADYDEFQSNYDVLELEHGTPFSAVTKAFHKLSLKWHPDKNKGCEECVEKYYSVSKAYQAISDYEKGILKLVRKAASK